MEITTVRGDGFCFLTSVCKAIEINYGEVIAIEKCMEIIMRYLVQNFTRYTSYHHQKSEAYSPGDTLIADVIDFFASRKYNTDIVDLLMQITTDALDLDLHIYQNNAGCVQVFNFISQNPKKVVHVKFTHDDQYPLGNHYDAITNVQPDINIRLLSQVAETVYSTQKRASVVSTKVEKEDVIDLTGDDGHSDETFISSDMESTGHFCSGHTTTTVHHLHPQQTPKVILHTFQVRCLLSLPTQTPLYLTPHQLSNRPTFHLQRLLSGISSVTMTVIWTV